MKKLTPAMQELHAAMLKGVICHYMPYMGRFTPNSYYFREDTMKHCTKAAQGLLDRGLVEKFGGDWRGHKLRAKSISPKEDG